MRNYMDADMAVKDNYRKMRMHQDYAFVCYMHKKYDALSVPMTIWEAVESLTDFVDISDPDVNLPNIIHMYQTAEAIRKDNGPDWLQLTGFIHDLGKCLYLRGCDADGTSLKEQWGIVGDTYVVGIPLPDELIYPEFNLLYPDASSSGHRYPDGSGLDNCLIAYGHDEYLYRVLQHSNLPVEALYIIRYHSLYPWHHAGCYKNLESAIDRGMKAHVQHFNKYDLYTKTNTAYTSEELQSLKDYYSVLIERYLPGTFLW